MKKYFPFALIIFIACNNVNPKTESAQIKSVPQNDSAIQKPEKIRFPKSEFEITEGGIGKLLLGEPFSVVEQKFSVTDTLTMSSEGYDWPAKIIDIGNGEWILAESNDGGKYITRLHTNSKKFKTIKGFHIGQRFSEILDSGEEIGLDFDEGFMSVRLYGEKVSFNVDTISENLFYNSKNQDLDDIPRNAEIIEFGIY